MILSKKTRPATIATLSFIFFQLKVYYFTDRLPLEIVGIEY